MGIQAERFEAEKRRPWQPAISAFVFPLPAADSRPGKPSSDDVPWAGKMSGQGELPLAWSVALDARVTEGEAARA